MFIQVLILREVSCIVYIGNVNLIFIIFAAPGSKSVMTAPKMYKSEYTNVGSGNPVIVWD